MSGFENLSGTSTEVKDKDGSDASNVKDMNLENAVSSASAPFTFKWTPRQGIYKVIFYAKTADASVAGWKVLITSQ